MSRLLGASSLVLVLAALALSGACTCSPTPSGPPPAPSACSTPADASLITALELGTGAPFAPGNMLSLRSGGQGLSMESFRVAVRATAPITCIAQMTDASGNTFTSPLAVSDAGGGWYASDEILVIGTVPLEVTTTAYGMTVSRHMSTTGSAIDAALPDAP